MSEAIKTALHGALIGVGIGILLFVVEYWLIRAGAAEHAKRMGKKDVELSALERVRLASVGRFCVVLPPAFALGFWIIWG